MSIQDRLDALKAIANRWPPWVSPLSPPTNHPDDDQTQPLFTQDEWDEIQQTINGKGWLSRSEYKKCECGAAKTQNPNCHAYYCPLFKDPS